MRTLSNILFVTIYLSSAVFAFETDEQVENLIGTYTNKEGTCSVVIKKVENNYKLTIVTKTKIDDKNNDINSKKTSNSIFEKIYTQKELLEGFSEQISESNSLLNYKTIYISSPNKKNAYFSENFKTESMRFEFKNKPIEGVSADNWELFGVIYQSSQLEAFDNVPKSQLVLCWNLERIDINSKAFD